MIKPDEENGEIDCIISLFDKKDYDEYDIKKVSKRAESAELVKSKKQYSFTKTENMRNVAFIENIDACKLKSSERKDLLASSIFLKATKNESFL